MDTVLVVQNVCVFTGSNDKSLQGVLFKMILLYTSMMSKPFWVGERSRDRRLVIEYPDEGSSSNIQTVKLV